MAEQKVTGQKYRVLVDAANRLWNRLSFWTSSVDVEMSDGNTLEDNLGAIKGITTSTNVGTYGYAADATTVSYLSACFGGLRFGWKDGKAGYFTGAGADTFYPFKRGVSTYVGHIEQTIPGSVYKSWRYDIPLSSLGLADKEIVGVYMNNTFCTVNASAITQTRAWIENGKVSIQWRDYNEQGVLGNFLSCDYFVLYYDY